MKYKSLEYGNKDVRSTPEAIIAFLEGNSFEEVIRLAISLGGDSEKNSL